MTVELRLLLIPKRMAIQKNLDTQNQTPAASGICVTIAMSCIAQSNEDQYGFSEISRIDAATAVNNVN